MSLYCAWKDLKDLKTDEILSRQLKQMEKEKQEMVNNLKKQEKKVGWRKEGYTELCVCVCACVRACVRVCVRACMCVRAQKGWCVCGICCI